MTRLLARWLGKRSTGGDRPVRVAAATYRAGILQVFLKKGAETGLVGELNTAVLTYYYGGTAASPLALKRVKLCNTSGGGRVVRLAMAASPTAAPGSSQAFLVYDLTLADDTMFEWAGYVPFVDRYLFGYASGSGVSLYTVWEAIHP